MAEENVNPEMTPAQARMAKARAARKSAATERESAPDTTTTPELEELKAKLAQVEADKEAALAQLEKATQPPPPPPPPVSPPPPAAMLPRNMRVERSGNISAAVSVRWPQIRGGTCEFCGVIDPAVPAQYQYKLCPHFRGMTARCTYCPENKDPDEVTYHANMNVAQHPDNPGVLIMWCNSFPCSDAHIKRFNKATA